MYCKHSVKDLSLEQDVTCRWIFFCKICFQSLCQAELSVSSFWLRTDRTDRRVISIVSTNSWRERKKKQKKKT